nr:hypothetical protein [Tanacetum cinerariifolium]
MGYEKPSTKLTFYKVFFLAQWKFLIHTILLCMSAKMTAWNEFSSSMSLAVICLATGRKFNFSKYIFDILVRNVDSSLKFYMYLRFLQLMIAAQVGDLSSYTTKYTSPALTQVFANIRRVGKGFSRVDTLLFKGMLVPQLVNDDVADVVADSAVEDENAAELTPPTHATTPPHQQELIPSTSQVAPTTPSSPHQSPMAPPSSPPQQQPSQTTTISMDLLNTLLETYTTLTRRVENLKQDKIAQAFKITKLKQRVRRLKKKNKSEPSCLKRLRKVRTAQRVESSADTVMDDQEDDADAQERLEESQAQDYHIDLEHADKVLITAVATTIMDAPITAAPSAVSKRKGVVIRDPTETSTPLIVVHYEPKSKDKGKGILVEEPKPLKKQAQIEQDEAYARELEAKLNANINWNEVIEQVKRKEKQDNAVLRYQALKRKPQTKAHARKNMMVYLKNMAGFKMDFFKGMSYDDIRPIFKKHFNSIIGFMEKNEKELEEEASKAIKRKNKSSKEKAVKKQKLDEEVEEFKTHL